MLRRRTICCCPTWNGSFPIWFIAPISSSDGHSSWPSLWKTLSLSLHHLVWKIICSLYSHFQYWWPFWFYATLPYNIGLEVFLCNCSFVSSSLGGRHTLTKFSRGGAWMQPVYGKFMRLVLAYAQALGRFDPWISTQWTNERSSSKCIDQQQLVLFHYLNDMLNVYVFIHAFSGSIFFH